MTRDEVKEFMAAIRAVYPKFCESDTNRKAAIDLWAAALVDVPLDEARPALMQHIRVCSFEPKPADIRKWCNKGRGVGQMVYPAPVWGQGKSAVRRELPYGARRRDSGLPAEVSRDE